MSYLLRPTVLLVVAALAVARAEDVTVAGRAAVVVVTGAKEATKYRLKFAKETLSLVGLLDQPVPYTVGGDKKKTTFTGKVVSAGATIEVSGSIDDKDLAQGTITRRVGEGEPQTISFASPGAPGGGAAGAAGGGATISGSYKVELVGKDTVAQIRFAGGRVLIPELGIDLPCTVVEDKRSKTKVFTGTYEDAKGNRLEVKGTLTDKGQINGTITKAPKDQETQVISFRQVMKDAPAK